MNHILSFFASIRPTAYITCVVADVDSASDADTSEALGMLTEAADSTTSGACFVRRLFCHASTMPTIIMIIDKPKNADKNKT